MKSRLSTGIWLIILGIIVSGCILMRSDSPDFEGENSDDSAITRLMRALGPDEIDKLLESPQDPVAPGLPVNHLLNMLDNIPLDNMIHLVREIGAERTLDLVLSIQRIGCNKAGYSLTNNSECYQCDLADYNHLDVMITLMRNINDIDDLIALINREGLQSSPGTTEEMRTYLEKVAFFAVYIESPSKMVNLVNGLIDVRDAIDFIDQFDQDLVPPATASNIAAQLPGLSKATALIKGVDYIDRVAYLLNGERNFGNGDAAQITFIADKLIPLIENGKISAEPVGHILEAVNDTLALTAIEPGTILIKVGQVVAGSDDGSGTISGPGIDGTGTIDYTTGDLSFNLSANPGAEAVTVSYYQEKTDFIDKTATLINNVANIDRMVDLLLLLDAVNLDNMLDMLDICNSPLDASPANNAINTIAYMVDNIENTSNVADMVQDVTPPNLAGLINDVSTNSQTADDGITEDLDAAGKKLTNVVGGVTEIDDLIFILDNISSLDNMADLLNALGIISTSKVATLVNLIEGVDIWDKTWDEDSEWATADGLGKLLNLIDNGSDLAEVAAILDNVQTPEKLAALINQLVNSNLFVDFVDAVIAEPTTLASDTAGLIDAIALSDVPKLVTIIETLNGVRLDFVAQLMASYYGPSLGLGAAAMGDLIGYVDVDRVDDLANLLLDINPTLNYRGGTITNTEGMVRLISAGVTYTTDHDIVFPGIGPLHTALLINDVTDGGIGRITTLLNGIDMANMPPLIGCADEIDDPDFNTPCTEAGLGW